MENLWKIKENKPTKNTDNIIEIMNEQSKYLEEETGGLVKGRFGPIRELFSGITSSSEALRRLMNQKTRIETKNSDDIETDFIDANDFYKDVKYGFEIVNNTYSFRPFTLDLKSIYPVIIKIDEDILKECTTQLSAFQKCNKEMGDYYIYNDEEYIKCLKIIFNCQKTLYIINKLKSNRR